MNDDNQVWCIPTDCVPFLAAALSWNQTYINIGNQFLSDTTEKVVTQIRDLIDLDEKRNIDETYEQGINEVFNQYRNIISARAASGDMPDQCVKEIICTLEQVKNRLLARAGKMLQGNTMDQIFKSIQSHLKEIGNDSKQMDSFKNELRRLMNNLSDNTEINAQTTITDTRSASSPMTPNQMEQFQKANLNDEAQSYRIRQQDQKISLISHSDLTQKDPSSSGKINSIYRTTPSIIKHTSDEFHEKVNTQKSHDHRNKDDSHSQQFSNKISSLTSKQPFLLVKMRNISFIDCADYDPYRNYDQYKAKRLRNNKQKKVS
ncbi:unnamed protein product [Rotaria magnacalcarata]|uniref:Uncharacterized protein n=1 Tax=Rotaria magnacalcarata TaxID=392030 RepID=A0A8S2M4D4_9BILA|nr:unnamed protein product [Rotaria magnacalcarata]CAF3955172.1 unnamed protein product [Rotaria magnacalcarata]